jgi:lipoprotein signal peptidase
LVVGIVFVASVLTGWLWRVDVDSGGITAAHNPISRYGPHWLYPLVAASLLTGLLALLWVRPQRIGITVSMTAFAAGAAGNLGQRLILGGVSNPVSVFGDHASIGDAFLWLGVIAVLGQALFASNSERTPWRPCLGGD